jgi:hypothetical protein
MLRRVALVRTEVSKELSAPIIRVTRIGTKNAPSSPIFVNLMKEALRSSEEPHDVTSQKTVSFELKLVVLVNTSSWYDVAKKEVHQWSAVLAICAERGGGNWTTWPDTMGVNNGTVWKKLVGDIDAVITPHQ